MYHFFFKLWNLLKILLIHFLTKALDGLGFGTLLTKKQEIDTLLSVNIACSILKVRLIGFTNTSSSVIAGQLFQKPIISKKPLRKWSRNIKELNTVKI